MEGYIKKFIYASLVYFFLAALIGVLYSIGHLGYEFMFVHVHFNLLGFMAMMVFGVGYFILPRFSGTVIKWPGLIGVHFWLANAGLVGMATARVTEANAADSAVWHMVFLLFAVLEGLSVLMFVVNLWASLASAPAEDAKPAKDMGIAPPLVLESDIIGDVLKKYPATKDVFRKFYGDGCFSCPGQAFESVTQSALMHSVDKNAVLKALNEAAAKGGVSEPDPVKNPPHVPERPAVQNHMPSDPKPDMPTCFNCSVSEKDAVLIRCRKDMKNLHVCTRCIPALIHG